MPWNPIGAILGPLGVVALIFGRRKKGSKTGTSLVLLLVMVTVGMTLSACGGGVGNGAPTTLPSVPPSGGTPMPGAGTNTGNGPSNPGSPTISPTTTPCPTPTVTNTPTATQTYTPTPTSTSTPTPTATPTSIQIAISYLQYSQQGQDLYDKVKAKTKKITIENSKDGKGHAIPRYGLFGNLTSLTIQVIPTDSPTTIAGTIAHESYHVLTPSDSLLEEYNAYKIGDEVRNDIINAGFGTSSDLRFPFSKYTVNLNNSNKTQLGTDLEGWFYNNGLGIYPDPKSQGGYGVPTFP